MNRYYSVLASTGGEIVYCLLCCLGNGTHGYDNAFSIRCSIVLKWTILATCELSDLSHVAGYDIRNGFVCLVAGLDSLEIYVSVLCCSSCHR